LAPSQPVLLKAAAPNTAAAAPSGPVKEVRLSDYLVNESRQLIERQKALQEQLQAKSKEMQSIRETILVVSGALQAVEHIANHAGVKLP
jgi:hypothetical protein